MVLDCNMFKVVNNGTFKINHVIATCIYGLNKQLLWGGSYAKR